MASDNQEDLAERVDELEETVTKMLPGRRGVLKGLGAAAIGGAAVGGATGGASGQSAAGQVGTSSSPVDVEAANVNAGSVYTDKLSTKDRPVVDVTAFGAVGDGSTDDTQAISDAVSHANNLDVSPVIYFPATGKSSGSSETPCDTEYAVDNAGGLVNLPAGATVVGDGRRSVALVASFGNDGTFVDAVNDGITVSDLYFDAAASNTNEGNGTTISLKGNHCVVQRCDLIDNSVLSVDFYGTRHSTLRDCRIKNAFGVGFVGVVGVRSDGTNISKYNTIANNEISNPDSDENDACIGISAGEKTRTEGNKLHDANQGIRYEDSAGNSNYNEHINERIYDVDLVGIECTYTLPTGTKIIGGSIEAPTADQGIRARHTKMLISGVTITDIDPSGNGIGIRVNDTGAGTNPVTDVKITDCHLSNMSEGIKDGGDNTVIHSNTVKDIKSKLGGIYTVSAASDTEIVNNTVKECQGLGIVDQAGGTLIKGNTAINNGQGTGFPTSGRAGLKTSGGTGAVIKDNFTKGNEVGYTTVANVEVKVIENVFLDGIQSGGQSEYAVRRDNEPIITGDVRNQAAVEGNRAYHDGTNANTVGEAQYISGGWVSLVDGTSIT